MYQLGDAKKLADKIKKKGGGELKSVSENLVDVVWDKNRPQRPNEKVRVHKVDYAGKEITEKLEDLRKELEKRKSPGFVVCKSLIAF